MSLACERSMRGRGTSTFANGLLCSIPQAKMRASRSHAHRIRLLTTSKGYLLLSLIVLGPGDESVPHDVDELEEGDADDFSKMVWTPWLSSKFLRS